MARSATVRITKELVRLMRPSDLSGIRAFGLKASAETCIADLCELPRSFGGGATSKILTSK
jgi:hypothetical protein